MCLDVVADIWQTWMAFAIGFVVLVIVDQGLLCVFLTWLQPHTRHLLSPLAQFPHLLLPLLQNVLKISAYLSVQTEKMGVV